MFGYHGTGPKTSYDGFGPADKINNRINVATERINYPCTSIVRNMHYFSITNIFTNQVSIIIFVRITLKIIFSYFMCYVL